MNYEKMTKKKLIEIIRDYKRREWEFLEGPDKDYYRFLLEDFNKKQDELEIRNEQLTEIHGHLEESREKYVELFDTAPVGYITLNDKGSIIEINKTGSELLGYDASTAKGLPLNIFIHKDYIFQYLSYISECRKTLKRKHARFRLNNGKYVQAVTRPYVSAKKMTFKVVIYDVTEIKKAEDTNAFLASIVEHSEDAIYTFTTEGEITSWNPAAEKMFGYTSSEILHKHITVIYPESNKEEYHKIIQRIFQTGSIDQYRTKNLTKGSRIIDVSASYSLLEKDENNSGSLVAIVRDITKQVAFEEKLSKSLREKELLLKEIHHRVKNNLQIISSLLNLQKTKITNVDVLEALKSSQNRIRAMALVHEKLYLSDNDAKINLREYITELTRFLYLSYPLQEKYIKLNQHIEEILVDIDLAIDVGLVLNELITNSLKYAFNDVDQGEIKLSVIGNNNEFEIKFADNGKGVPDEFLEFENSLGLTLVQSLVEQNNGTIDVSNHNGTKFLIKIRNKPAH
jgi:PAS domain S-box-containing protein